MLIYGQHRDILTDLSAGPLMVDGKKVVQVLPRGAEAVIASCESTEAAQRVLNYIATHAELDGEPVIVSIETDRETGSGYAVVYNGED